jgi:hypothetical protein
MILEYAAILIGLSFVFNRFGDGANVAGVEDGTEDGHNFSG